MFFPLYIMSYFYEITMKKGSLHALPFLISKWPSLFQDFICISKQYGYLPHLWCHYLLPIVSLSTDFPF